MAGKYPLKWADVDVQVFRAGGKGGQHQNKTETGVRLIHRPTGVRVEARSERSQTSNKEAAFANLQAKLDGLVERRQRAARREDYDAKPEAAHGSQIRTVRLVGKDQGVVDHRTGVGSGNARAYLAGDLDRFLVAGRGTVGS